MSTLLEGKSVIAEAKRGIQCNTGVGLVAIAYAILYAGHFIADAIRYKR